MEFCIESNAAHIYDIFQILSNIYHEWFINDRGWGFTSFDLLMPCKFRVTTFPTCGGGDLAIIA